MSAGGRGRAAQEHAEEQERWPSGLWVLKGGCAGYSMAVSCGSYCTFVVGEEGQVLVSGCGRHGQLGLGDTQDRLRMTRVAGDFTVRVVMVSTGWGHSALQDSDGELWMCGFGGNGQLGTGGREDMLTPTRVPKCRLGRARVKMAACGNHHTLVLTEAGRVWAYGRGEDGRLGTGDEDDRTTPTEVAGLRGVTITFVAAGGSPVSYTHLRAHET